MNRIKTLKFADKTLGKLLVSLLSKPKSHTKRIPKSIERLLVIRPGGIGDAVLILPAIRAFKQRFPDCRIDIPCEKRNADVFRLSGHVNHIYLYDRGSDFLKCVSGKKYDAVIDTEQWHRLSA